MIQDDELSPKDLIGAALIGLITAVTLGLFLPPVMGAIFTQSSVDAAIIHAGNETMARLGRVLRGDFSDGFAWGVPLFGILTGAMIKVVSKA